MEEIVSMDNRGCMIKYTFGKKVFWFAYTNQGCARGGEFHPVTQYVVVIDGSLLFKMMKENGEEQRQVDKGDIIIIPANIPHVAIALANTISIEWHDGELPPFEQKNIYEPYRRIVRKNDK